MRAHVFRSTREAYDATQSSEDVRAGDLLIVASEKVIGVAYAWPFAITHEHGVLHIPDSIDKLIESFTNEQRYPWKDQLLNGIAAAVELAAELEW